MQKFSLLIIILFIGCSRPLYVKEKHFNCSKKSYSMDTDRKQLIYKVLTRAVVIEKDIPDYRLLWKKDRIYIDNEYLTGEMDSLSTIDLQNQKAFLQPDEVPNKIGNIRFCLKSKEELQKIADKTWEDFLHLSFDFIIINGNTASISINNTWLINKHSKKESLSGGGYICIYKKINGEWHFKKITSNWIS